jgi:hypothetical protein
VLAVHETVAWLSRELLSAFTDHTAAPPPGRRHPLLPTVDIRRRLAALDLSESGRRGLSVLAEVLQELPPQTISGLARHPCWRARHVSLNQPCYTLNLCTPETNSRTSPLPGAREVYLAIQVRLFTPIGGAGLLSLGGVPSVRIVRGEGRFTRRDWEQRAAFQRDFAVRVADTLAGAAIIDEVREFRGAEAGWRES